jgi:hypothetical protein
MEMKMISNLVYLLDESGREIAPVPVETPGQVPHYRIICAWCDTVMEQGAHGAEVSHAICPTCFDKVAA